MAKKNTRTKIANLLINSPDSEMPKDYAKFFKKQAEILDKRANTSTDPVGTVTEWGSWRKGKKGIAKKTFPGTNAKKKTLTNKSTNTSPQRKILFTGLDKADFKMGNKMLKVVREAVKKYGKENVTLIHGGRPDKSIIDKNIKALGEHTGIKVESDPLDYNQKNASDARLQKRIDDPDLEWHSFDKKGNLSKKDKHETWARKTYENLKSEKTYRIGSKQGYIGTKFSSGSDKSKGRSQETSKFKSFLDILEDEPNPDKQESGIKHARKVDAWTKENRGYNLITDKNRPRIDFIEEGKGSPTFQREYTAIENLENPNKAYVDDTSQSTETSQRRKGLKGSITTTKWPPEETGKTKILRNRGTILTGHKDPAPPTNVSPKYLDAPKPFKGGPDIHPKTSSIVQFENPEHAEPQEHREAKRKALQDTKIDLDVDVGEDSSRSGKGVERHKSSHLRKQGVKEKLELRDDKKFKSIFAGLRKEFDATKDPNLSPQQKINQRKALDRRSRSILTQMSNVYGNDAAPQVTAGGDNIGSRQKSVTITDIKSPSPHFERKIPERTRIKAKLRADQRNPLVETKATPEKGRRQTPQSGLTELKILNKRMENIQNKKKPELPLGARGRWLAPIHYRINQRSKVRTKNPQEATTSFQPQKKIKKVTSTNVPSQTAPKKTSKVPVTSATKKVASGLIKFFKNRKVTPDVKKTTAKTSSFGKVKPVTTPSGISRPPVINPTKTLKGLAPFALGVGALQNITGEAYGEKAFRDVERGSFKSKGGGRKNPFLRKGIPGETNDLLTRVFRKRFRKVA